LEALGALAILFGFGLALAVVGFVIWAAVDAARHTGEQWRQARQSKALWVTVILGGAVIGCGGFGWVGALLYVLIPRPALKRTRLAGLTRA
jgi:hypothetical protein